jgi:hypothetical protein
MFEYSGIWNLIGFPCLAFPVTKVHANEQFFKDHFNDKWSENLHQNAKDSKGLPVGLQLISSSNEDEKLLAIMKLIEQELKIKVRAPRMSEESVGHYVVKNARYTVMPLEMTNRNTNNNMTSYRNTVTHLEPAESADEEKTSFLKAEHERTYQSVTVTERKTEAREEEEDSNSGSEEAIL